jgi:hypothetical protein
VTAISDPGSVVSPGFACCFTLPLAAIELMNNKHIFFC